jgi:hypothetical protein
VEAYVPVVSKAPVLDANVAEVAVLLAVESTELDKDVAVGAVVSVVSGLGACVVVESETVVIVPGVAERVD